MKKLFILIITLFVTGAVQSQTCQEIRNDLKLINSKFQKEDQAIGLVKRAKEDLVKSKKTQNTQAIKYAETKLKSAQDSLKTVGLSFGDKTKLTTQKALILHKLALYACI